MQALQLLEFLVKNGSERVVDDARSHMSLLRMLRQFHFIDMNGKDQGINVRNRSSELVKLLGDVDQIRAERKKARANRNKFSGFEGGMNVGSGGMSSSGRYGGFGSDSMGYGGYSGGVFGDGGGFGGASSDFQDTGTARRGNRFEEYDEYDEGDISPPRAREPATTTTKREPKKPEPEPVPDLFDFGDDEPATTTTSSTAAGKQPASSGLNMLDPTPADDDDFDDFQSATPAAAPAAPASSNQFAIPPPASTASTTSNTQFVAPKPVSASQGANIDGLVGFTSGTTTPTSSITSPASQAAPVQQQQPQHAHKPSGFQAATPNYFTSVSTNSPQQFPSHGNKPSISSPATSIASNKPASSASKPSGDAFGSLWSSASASAGITKSNSNANKGPNLNSMAKEKASAGIWGAPASTPSTATGSPAPSQPQQQQKQQGGSAFDDLLG